MNRLDGYFVLPVTDSLSERLVGAPGRGAIASFSPSGMSLRAPASRYHDALLRELARGRPRGAARIGPVRGAAFGT